MRIPPDGMVSGFVVVELALRLSNLALTIGQRAGSSMLTGIFIETLLGNCVVVGYGPLHIGRRVANGRRTQGCVLYAEDTELGWNALQILNNPVKIRVRGAVCQAGTHGILGSLAFRNWFGGWIQQNRSNAWQRPVHFKKRRELRCCSRSHGASKQVMLHGPLRIGSENARNKLPTSRGRKCIGIAVEFAKQFAPETQKCNHLWPNRGLDGPFRPLLHIYLKFKMDEAIPQRSRHFRRCATIRIAVSCGYNGPTIRQSVLTKSAVEHKLVTTRLDHRWSSI